MKTPVSVLTLLVIATLALGGCISPRSPVTAPTPANTTNLREGLTLGGSAAAGAGIGYAITKDATGAAVGGVAGLAGGALLNNKLANDNAQREAELMAAGERKGRAEVLSQYWEAERYNSSSAYFTPNTGVRYEGGYVDSVNFAPRKSETPSGLAEPKRP